MSTIATPRDSSLTRRSMTSTHPSNVNTTLHHQQNIPQIHTPTSSSRPSLDLSSSIRSADVSPSRAPGQPAKRNRAALREYYNLQSSNRPTHSQLSDLDTRSETSSIHDQQSTSSPLSVLDSEDFNAEEYVKRVLEEESLGGVLSIYSNVLQEIRALDAERKGLVYDNYSKLIAATEMIGRMRGGVGGGDGVGRTVGPAVKEIYERVDVMREEMRGKLSKGQNEEREMDKEERIARREMLERKRKEKDVVKRVLETPAKVRLLVQKGSIEEARNIWEPVRRVLERWRERGVGGEDVGMVLEEGEKALRGEIEKS